MHAWTIRNRDRKERSIAMNNLRYCAWTAVLSVLGPIALGASPPVPKFDAQTIDPEVKIGYGVVVGDVDGDKRPDILLADKKQFVWFRNPGKPGERWPRFVMAENLTELDNVCIAARDINGDGKVEVAVGGQWNPGETSDIERSGAIFYLIRPDDPTAAWKPVRIEPHDPTTHRMLWVGVGDKRFVLAVLPLHGKDNKAGEGTPVRLQVITPPADPSDPKAKWESRFVETGMHMTHNFDVSNYASREVVIAGREGARWIEVVPTPLGNAPAPAARFAFNISSGEVRFGLVTISPMHGNRVISQRWVPDDTPAGKAKHMKRPIDVVVDDTLREGHALDVADLLKLGRPQIVAGWRMPNAEKKVGIKLYVSEAANGDKWAAHVIDDNTMACEDLKIADLDGDGRLDIVASGRATHNLVVYWNKSE